MKKYQSTAVRSLVKEHGEPLFKVVFDVFGTKPDKHVNPKAHATMTFFGEDFKHCKGQMVSQTDGAFYKVKEVMDLNPEYSVAHTNYVFALQQSQKERAA